MPSEYYWKKNDICQEYKDEIEWLNGGIVFEYIVAQEYETGEYKQGD